MNRQNKREILSFVRFSLVFIIACSILFSGSASAQSEHAVVFGADFTLPQDVRIPFGKKVLISGTVDPTLTKMKVHWVVNSSEGEAEANIKAGRWTAVVGPFPARQSVIFRFETVSMLSEKERARIKSLVQQAINNLVQKVISERIEKTPDEFKAYVELKLREVLPLEFKKFVSPAGKALYDIVIEEILSLDAGELLKKVFSNVVDRNTRSRDINESLETLKRDFLDTKEFESIIEQYRKDEKQEEIGLLENTKLNPEDLPREENKRKILSDAIIKSGLTEVKKQELSNRLDDMGKLQDEIQNIDMELDALIKGITDKVSFKIDTFESAQVAETSADVSALEYYAGFDVAALAVPNEAAVGGFFTINLYKDRVELDSDPKSLRERLSLTTGIGLTTSEIETEGSVYYIGLGYRLSRFFRITAGSAFFKKEDKDKFDWDFAGGISVNFKYIGDLIRIFNAASSTMPGQIE